MDPYREKFFVPFLVPVVPLAIALAAIGGVGFFTVGVVGLAVWLAWRQSWRAMRGCGGGPAEPAGRRGPPPPPTAPPPPAAAGPSSPASPRPARSEPVPSKEALPAALARAAARRGGSITVSEGVVETGAEMLEVSEVLDRLDRDGYVTAIHRPGVDELVYRFQEIAPSPPPA